MVIQAWCSTPPSLPTMVGMAVETMVWSRLESSMPAIRAEKMIQMRFWVSSSGSAAAGRTDGGAHWAPSWTGSGCGLFEEVQVAGHGEKSVRAAAMFSSSMSLYGRVLPAEK